jgi:TRAP-type mannitol/chloroaromatic compound transport system permease large subunit
LNNLAFARLASYDLSVIPLFLLMGHLATQGGISKSLFEFTSAVMSRFRGGLAMGAVLASAAFGSICGSSVATAATITTVAHCLKCAAAAIQWASGDRHTGRGWHVGHFDSALRTVGDLCHSG